MATAFLSPIDPPTFDWNNPNWREDEQEYIDTLAEMARKNGDSDLLGYIARWGRADGCAMYMVWNIKPLELIHLPLGDAWQVEDALIRGLLVSDIEQMKARDALFTGAIG